MKLKLSRVAVMAVGVLAGCAAPTAQPVVGPPTTRNDVTCLKDTGSRIPADASACSATGRSYSNEDISRTGSTTAAGALQLLDPSVTVRH
jgi:hypothetical protein